METHGFSLFSSAFDIAGKLVHHHHPNLCARVGSTAKARITPRAAAVSGTTPLCAPDSVKSAEKLAKSKPDVVGRRVLLLLGVRHRPQHSDLVRRRDPRGVRIPIMDYDDPLGRKRTSVPASVGPQWHVMHSGGYPCGTVERNVDEYNFRTKFKPVTGLA